MRFIYGKTLPNAKSPPPKPYTRTVLLRNGAVVRERQHWIDGRQTTTNGTDYVKATKATADRERRLIDHHKATLVEHSVHDMINGFKRARAETCAASIADLY